MKSIQIRKSLLLIFSGGLLLQLGGCGIALAPLVLGLGENVLLSLLFGGGLGL